MKKRYNRQMTLGVRITTALSLILAVVAVAAPARAKAPGGFSKAEIEAITPLFKRHGVIALAESDGAGAPKAMTIAIQIDAPREAVFKVFEKPENFYLLLFY